MYGSTNIESHSDGQRGAALVTVVMVSLLLITASVAMLTAVGANSRNTTDVLAETKAYYAAESGLQATVNAFRNSDASYDAGVSDPDLSDFLLYNWPTSGTPTRKVIGQAASDYNPNAGAAYSILVSDPDNSAVSTTFTTLGGLAAATGPTYVTSRTYGTSPNTTTISLAGIGVPTTIPHPDASEVIGNFQVSITGTGGLADITPTRFRLEYSMSLPRPATLLLEGEYKRNTAGTGIEAVFDDFSYTILGGTIQITPGGGAASRTLNLLPATVENVPVSTPVDATIAPVKPYRLKVLATGYGPNGAKKRLEAILQKDLFNGLGSGAATSMIGAPCPTGQVCFAAGNSNGVTYNGCPPDPNSPQGCVPSFGVTDPTTLAYIIDHPPGNNPAQMTPPPVLLNPSQIPPWQSSPQALDLLVDQLRQVSQNSGRYFYNPGNTQISNPGSWATGEGITFCEGSCRVAGDGGGILVVTGQLTNVGGFNFRGMIIVTGEGGWERSGGGNGQVIGNIVIAPYNQLPYVPENLTSTFLPPRYQITGGGGSTIFGGDVIANIGNTSGVSDFVAGVAEK